MSGTRWRAGSATTARSPRRPSRRRAEAAATRCAAPSRHIKSRGGGKLRIGVERAFLPADAEDVLREALPVGRDRRRHPAARAAARAKDARRSLSLLRKASDGVIDSMLAVIAAHGPGTTKRELAEALRQRGGEARPQLRVLPDRLRREPQPRALRPGVARGRRAVARFRRQLPRLYRRPRPHGRARRAGPGAHRPPRRGGGDPAGDARADRRRRDGQRGLPGGRGGDRQVAAAPSSSASPRTAWG